MAKFHCLEIFENALFLPMPETLLFVCLAYAMPVLNGGAMANKLFATGCLASPPALRCCYVCALPTAKPSGLSRVVAWKPLQQ